MWGEPYDDTLLEMLNLSFLPRADMYYGVDDDYDRTDDFVDDRLRRGRGDDDRPIDDMYYDDQIEYDRAVDDDYRPRFDDDYRAGAFPSFGPLDDFNITGIPAPLRPWGDDDEMPDDAAYGYPGPPFDDENRRRGPARPPASSAPCAARPPTAVAPKRPPEATSA